MSEKRISLCLTEEMMVAINDLKREQYYNKSYAELLRDIIQAGLDAVKKEE